MSSSLMLECWNFDGSLMDAFHAWVSNFMWEIFGVSVLFQRFPATFDCLCRFCVVLMVFN